MEFNKPRKKKVWHTQQEKILKVWGEQSACYRFMHFKAYQKYKKLSLRFTLPIIIISTITGTANFAQNTFPVAWRPLVPSGIGAFNLVAAIMTTILQFLKINELMESHRVSSVHYGKLSRSVRLQLTLPRDERSQDGSVFVEYCNQEYDRLIEQSPSIPDKIIKLFEKEFPIIKHKKNPEDQQRTCCLDIQQYCCTSFNDEIDEKDLNLERPEIIKLTPIKPFGFSDGTTRSDSAQTVNTGTAAATPAPDPRPRFKSYPSTLPLTPSSSRIEKTKILPQTTFVEPDAEVVSTTPSPGSSLIDSEEVVVNIEELKQKFNQQNF
jgi:hypothetical protein